MNETDIQKFLDECSVFVNKYETVSKSVEKKFNIFSILDVATDEVRICRVLHEFLSPNGSHNQKEIFLRKFIEEHLGLKDFNFPTARVSREYVIEKTGRRIDLVIESSNYYIPIEVKINAGDQDSQCFDYYKFAESYTKNMQNCENPFIVYLTIDGKKPSKKSRGNLKDAQVKNISFEKDIKKWLESTSKMKEVQYSPILIETIKQFSNTIDTYKNKVVEDEMVKKIKSSKKNMQSAYFIKKHFNEARIEMLRKIFSEINEYVISLTKPKTKNNEKYSLLHTFKDVEEQVAKYYSKPNKADVVLQYEYAFVEEKRKKILFEVRLDDCLYWGFVVENTVKINYLDENILKKYLPQITSTYKVKEDGKWIAAEYFIDKNVEKRPVFSDMKTDSDLSEKYFELFDTDPYEKFMKNCKSKIEELLSLN